MEPRSRKNIVLQFLDDKLINRYSSKEEAIRLTKISKQNMNKCLNGKRKHCEGFVFIYENKEL